MDHPCHKRYEKYISADSQTLDKPFRKDSTKNTVTQEVHISDHFYDFNVFLQKIKTAFRPSKNWGPKDPMQRYTWMQWCIKIQQGERDFTLRRRGTRDYTKGIKKEIKKNAIQTKYITQQNISSVDYQKNKTGDKNISPNTHRTVLTNENEMIYTNGNETIFNEFPRNMSNDNHIEDKMEIKKNMNPLARNSSSDTSEDLAVLRKGPYVIGENSIAHVCHRKYSYTEDATEL